MSTLVGELYVFGLARELHKKSTCLFSSDLKVSCLQEGMASLTPVLQALIRSLNKFGEQNLLIHFQHRLPSVVALFLSRRLIASSGKLEI